MAGFGAGKSISIKRFARNYITSICILRRYLFPIQDRMLFGFGFKFASIKKTRVSQENLLNPQSFRGVSELKMNDPSFLLEGHPQEYIIRSGRKINIRSRNSEISALLAGGCQIVRYSLCGQMQHWQKADDKSLEFAYFSLESSSRVEQLGVQWSA